MATLRWLGCAIVGVVAVAYAPPASGWRCGNELVAAGDYAYEVRRACGPPDAVERVHRGHPHPYRAPAERWYYDRGDNRLLRVLHLIDGRVRRIETRDHGLEAGAGDGQCDPYAIHDGMSSYRLLRLCGEPVQRATRRIPRAELPRRHWHWAGKADRPGHGHAVVEEWIYPFDERYLARRVRLIRGEVVAVDTLE